MTTTLQIVLDCADPSELAAFWADALGYIVQPPPGEHESWESFLAELGVPEDEWNSASAVIDPDGTGPRLFFQRVPEPKVTKNRVHMDLNVGGGPSVPMDVRRERLTGEAERLRSLGAVRVRDVEERDEYWIVMQDPEGNEFCIQ